MELGLNFYELGQQGSWSCFIQSIFTSEPYNINHLETSISEKCKNPQFEVKYFILETRLWAAVDLDLIHPKFDFN